MASHRLLQFSCSQLESGAAVHIFHTVARDSPGKHRTVVPLPREAYASLTLEVTWLIP